MNGAGWFDSSAEPRVITPCMSRLRACHDGGRKRQERDEHQVQRVEEQQRVIRPYDPVEHGVMIEPDRPNDDEADRMGQAGGPEVEQAEPEGLAFVSILFPSIK